MRILAHRGLVSEFVPENTTKAFSDALAAGADVIETDIQVTADDVAVVFHDEDLFRLAGLKAQIRDLTFAELELIDIGHGKRVPALEQVLTAFPTEKFNFDIKTDAGVAPTVAVIEKLSAHDRILISSFSEARRKTTLALLSKPCRTSAGVSKVLKLYAASLLRSRYLFKKIASGSDALQIPTHKGLIRLDSPNFIAMAKRANLEVHFWTINTEKEMQRLAALGATGIVTDHCDVAVKALK